MRYFLDTEFAEDGRTIDLISITIVAEDGREFYAVSTEFDAEKCNPWVKENVLPKLPPRNESRVRRDCGHGCWMSRQRHRRAGRDGVHPSVARRRVRARCQTPIRR